MTVSLLPVPTLPLACTHPAPCLPCRTGATPTHWTAAPRCSVSGRARQPCPAASWRRRCATGGCWQSMRAGLRRARYGSTWQRAGGWTPQRRRMVAAAARGSASSWQCQHPCVRWHRQGPWGDCCWRVVGVVRLAGKAAARHAAAFAARGRWPWQSLYWCMCGKAIPDGRIVFCLLP